MVYIVQVTQRTGLHVTASVPILATESPAVALTAACGADAGGYPLVADGDGTRVFRLDPRRMELGGSESFAEPKTLVFARIREEKGWSVRWYDAKLERTYGQIFNALPA